MVKLQAGVMEKGRQSSDRLKIDLLGPDAIKEFPRFQYLDVSGIATFESSFGEDTKCYYVLEQYGNTTLNYYERGIGYIEPASGIQPSKLVREIRIVQGVNPTQLTLSTVVPADFTSDSDELLVVTANFPSSYLEALLSPHSVLSSSATQPQITTMPSGSILGRLDGNIEAIEASELAVSDYLKNTMSNYQGNVSANLLALTKQSRPGSPVEDGLYLIDSGGETSLEIYSNSIWNVIWSNV